MSHFVKDIVSEVLRRNRATKEMPMSKQEENEPAKQQEAPQVPVFEQSIPGIYRPNYQKQKRQDRLSMLSTSGQTMTRPVAVPSDPSNHKKDFGVHQLSELQRLILANINETQSRRR